MYGKLCNTHPDIEGSKKFTQMEGILGKSYLYTLSSETYIAVVLKIMLTALLHYLLVLLQLRTSQQKWKFDLHTVHTRSYCSL